MVLGTSYFPVKGTITNYRDARKKLTGVYAIRNITNDDIYIGSTAIGFGERFCEHKSLLNRKVHNNPILQAAWNKYGQDSFFFGIVEVCEKHETLIREQFFLDSLNPKYNLAKVAESNFRGRKHSNESKKKMSISRSGRPWSESSRPLRIAAFKIAYAQLSEGDKAKNTRKLELARAMRTPETHKRAGAAVSKALTGKKLTAEHRAAVSRSITNWWANRKLNG